MSWDDKKFMERGFRVRHKYARRRKGYSVCERCSVKRRSTSSGWEYFDPARQPQPVDGSKAKPYWTSANPPCVKREEPKQPEPFTAKAELTNDDLNVLHFFFSFAAPLADRAAAGFKDPEVAHYPDFLKNWYKLSDILDRLHKSTGAAEHLAGLSVKERRALGRKIARAAAQRAKARA